MNPQKIQFDDTLARTYRKRLEVLAFRSDDPICFRKSWGDQEMREHSWVIVPLSETGEATRDIFGCDGQAFEATYEPSPSLEPNRYRKMATVRAYQPGISFTVDTVLSDGHVEVSGSKADSTDSWIVSAPDGEIYPVENEVFERTYIEVPEDMES